MVNACGNMVIKKLIAKCDEPPAGSADGGQSPLRTMRDERPLGLDVVIPER
jgi:hypothetical protein